MFSSPQRTIRTLLLGILLSSVSPALHSETQTFTLAAQWNLVTFQVTPANPDPQILFSTLPGFLSAWTYNASNGVWLRYIKPAGTATQQTNDATANQLFTLPPIQPGHAYWIQMANSFSPWQVNGTVPTGVAFPALDLRSGWNLIGIPVGATTVSNTEPVSLLAVLTAAGFDYDAMLTLEAQSYRKMFRPQGDTNQLATNVLAGLPPDPPFPSFNLQTDLGRGYWIHVLDPAILRPRLIATVRPDIDAEPLNNFPSKEDLNVSGATVNVLGAAAQAGPKSVETQDTIRFFAGEDVQTLGISNLGDGTNSGGGILLWEVIWIPTTDLMSPEPWIRLFASPDQRESRDLNGQLLAPYTNLTGVTTLENDIVYLRLDRKNLGRGNHEGTLLLRSSVGDKSYHVLAEVPGLEGDFKGYAVIASVNGKRNPVPDIDLNVSLYEDTKVDGLLRGLIDSSQALLWPVDVPLVGYRVANEGNQFILGGSFVLPPGDQNGEPFDVFDENPDAAAGADVDWLNDGVLDVRNPFPFPVQRTVSFEGALIKGNPTDGYVLEGKYTEIVYGMSKQPITLAGIFHLERQAVRPLSTRRLVTSDTGRDPVVTKKSVPSLQVLPGATQSDNISIQTEMDLRSLQVSLAFDVPLPHSSLYIRLQSPGTAPVTLDIYDGRNAKNAINSKLLESLTFPLDRPFQGDLNQFARNVPQTRTEPALNRFWKIIISNTGGQSVTLANWTLRLDGQPVTNVIGVVKNGTNPVAGVTVALDGVPFSLYSSQSGADGRFTLARVPLLPLNFSATRPGYVPADPTQPGLSTNFTRPFVGQPGLSFTLLEATLINRFNPLAGAPVALAGVAGFSAGTSNSPFELQLRPEATGQPKIFAGPLTAFGGSTVEFYALNPAATLTWQFGDGMIGTNAVESHVYQLPGYYRARLFSPSGGGGPQATVGVVALPAPGHAPQRPADLGGEPTGLPTNTANSRYTAYVFQPFFTIAGVVPAHKVTGGLQGPPDIYLSDMDPKMTFASGETNAFGAAYVSILPIQHMYAVSMESLDLAPHTSPANTSRPFDSDLFTALTSPGSNLTINTSSQGFRNEDFNYSHLAALWENTRAADGSVEYIPDATEGLIVWGNTLDPMNQKNYSTQPYLARDGTPFSFALNDNVFHPHTGTTTLTDLETHNVVNHYRMACSIGATILTAPLPGSAVKPAKLKRSLSDKPLDPALNTAPAAVSRNLYFRLQTGALGVQ